MGWTSYVPWRRKANGEIDRKAECDDLLNEEQFTILKSNMVGTTYYAAIKTKLKMVDYQLEGSLGLYQTIPEDEQEVWAAVVLTSVQNGTFYYKDMSEDVGPSDSKCPASILKLLTPTENEYANAWRKRCWENIEKKKDPKSLSNLPIGAVIQFPWNGKSTRVVKRAPNKQFKRTWWHNVENNTYIPQRYIPENYEVIKAG